MKTADEVLTEYSQKTKSASPEAALLESGFAGKPVEYQGPPLEFKPSFIQTVKDRAYLGVLEKSVEFNKMIGLGSNELTKNIFISPSEEKIEELRRTTKDLKHPAKQFAYDFSESLGGLGLDLPATVMMGAASKMALAGKMIPEAEALLSRIPSFALGMGEEAGVKAAEEGKEPIKPALEATSWGLLYGKIGAGPEGMTETAKQVLKRSLLSIPALASVGAAESIYQAFKEERYPKKDDIIKGSAMGAAYGTLFAALPILKSTSDIRAQGAYDKLETSIQKAVSAQDIEKKTEIRIEGPAQEVSLDNLKKDVVVFMLDESVPARDKEVVAEIMNNEHSEDPGTGEQVPVKDIRKKGILQNIKDSVQGYFKEPTKKLEFDFQKLRTQNAVDEILGRRLLKELNISNEQAEELLMKAEDEMILGIKPEFTPELQKVYDEFVKPFIQKISDLKNDIRNDGHSADTDIIPRNVIGKGGLIDRIKQGIGRLKSGLLRTSSGHLKKREMKILKASDGERVVANIEKGRVTAFRKGEPEDLGNFSLSKNIELLKDEIEPAEKRIRNLKRERRTLESVRVRQPVSKNRIENLKEKAKQIQDYLSRPEEPEPAQKKIYETFAKEIKKINKEIEELSTKKETLEPYEGEVKRIDKALERISDKIDDLYIKELDLSLSDVFDKVSDFVKKNEKDEIESESADNRAAQKLKLIQKEIKTLSKVKSSEDLVLRKRRMETIDRKISEAEDEINGIISRYELENLNNKVFEDKNGKRWTVGDATVQEIEANTRLRYHKNIVHSLLLAHNELQKVKRAKDFLNDFKESPEFKKIGIKSGTGQAPEGWKPTKLRQFAGYTFEPRVADALDYFSSKIERGEDAFKNISAVNNFLRTTIFFNPFIHVPNIAVHWFVNRGLKAWAMPEEYKTLTESGYKAIDAVVHQNGDYLEMLSKGVNLLHWKDAGDSLSDMLHSKMNDELTTNLGVMGKVSKALGYANPVEWVKAWYKFSSNVTWASNDIATMQAIYEEMSHGKTMDQAIEDVGKHIPNYIIPSRILDSRAISEVMSNPNISMFGAYHYGALKSYGNMVRSLITGPGKEKAEAIDKMLALGFTSLVIYPALDKLAQTVTGRKEAHLRRAGASTFFENLSKLIEHKIDHAQFIQSIVTPSVGTKMALELYFNKDFFTGKSKIQTGEELESLKSFAMSGIAPAQYAERIKEGKITVGETLLGMAGVSFSDPNKGKFFRLSESKGEKQKKIDTLFKSDPEKAKEQASKFNEFQLKNLNQILKEEKITLTKREYDKLASKLVIKAEGSKFKSGQTVEDMFTKHKVQKRKKIKYTSEQEEKIDKIMKEYFN